MIPSPAAFNTLQAQFTSPAIAMVQFLFIKIILTQLFANLAFKLKTHYNESIFRNGIARFQFCKGHA